MGGGDLFVGRERELALLDAHRRAAAAGGARLVLVLGEQGAGKTRLVGQACAAARAEGAQVVAVACWDEPGGPAYAPWVQVLAALRRDPRQDVLQRLSPLERVALAPLTLDAPDDPPVRPVDQAHQQFLLHRAAAAVLRAATDAGLLVLAVDDLHAADVPSLRLLREVLVQVQDAPLLVLATVREDLVDPECAELDRLRRSAEVLHLGGLERAAVDAYVTARLPAVEATLRGWLWEASDGNPLFLRELVALAGAGRGGSLPETLATAVRRRLDALPVPAREVVDMAAVLGRDVSLLALGPALDLAPEQLLERLDEAVRQGVLVLEPASSQVRFAHGLFREVVLRELGVRCRPLHARAALVLEQLHGDTAERAADIADQHYRALPLGDPGRARSWAVRAAEHAVARLSFADAAALLAQALEARPADEDPAERSRLLDRLADAHFRAGHAVPAREAWRAAAHAAREAGDPAALAAAALGLAREFAWGRYDSERASLLEEALAAQVDVPTRVHLQARLSTELYWTEQRERRQQLSEQALALARSSGDPRALAAALRGRMWAFRDPETVDLRVRESEELLAVAGGDPEAVAEGRYHRIVALLEKGELRRAYEQVDAHERLAEELHHPVYRWRAGMWRAMRLQVAGRTAEAREAVEATRRLGEVAGEPNTELIHAGQRAENERWTGWTPATEQLVAEVAPRLPAIPLMRHALLAIRAARDPAAARPMLDTLLEETLPFDSSWLAMHLWLSEACEALGAAEQAAALLPRLRPYAGLWLVSGGGAACQGPVLSMLGSLELTSGNPEAAAPLLAEAREVAERAGAPVCAAVDGVRLGVALRLQGLPDEGVLEAALAQARRLGLTRLLRRSLPDPVAPAHRGPAGTLTPREREVLALLADGRSNREIAAALYVTEKTVKTHISAVLGKLQCTDRTQAALYAVRHGLAR